METVRSYNKLCVKNCVHDKSSCLSKTAGFLIHSVKCKTKDRKNERHTELLEAINTNKRQKCIMK